MRLRRKLHRLSEGGEDRRNKALKNAGLAAAVFLVPGGFILGTTLAVRYYQKRRAEKAAAQAEQDEA